MSGADVKQDTAADRERAVRKVTGVVLGLFLGVLMAIPGAVGGFYLGDLLDRDDLAVRLAVFFALSGWVGTILFTVAVCVGLEPKQPPTNRGPETPATQPRLEGVRAWSKVASRRQPHRETLAERKRRHLRIRLTIAAATSTAAVPWVLFDVFKPALFAAWQKRDPSLVFASLVLGLALLVFLESGLADVWKRRDAPATLKLIGGGIAFGLVMGVALLVPMAAVSWALVELHGGFTIGYILARVLAAGGWLAIAIATPWVWAYRREHPPGDHTAIRCDRCSYNLLGTTGAACPECGEPLTTGKLEHRRLRMPEGV